VEVDDKGGEEKENGKKKYTDATYTNTAKKKTCFGFFFSQRARSILFFFFISKFLLPVFDSTNHKRKILDIFLGRVVTNFIEISTRRIREGGNESKFSAKNEFLVDVGHALIELVDVANVGFGHGRSSASSLAGFVSLAVSLVGGLNGADSEEPILRVLMVPVRGHGGSTVDVDPSPSRETGVASVSLGQIEVVSRTISLGLELDDVARLEAGLAIIVAGLCGISTEGDVAIGDIARVSVEADGSILKSALDDVLLGDSVFDFPRSRVSPIGTSISATVDGTFDEDITALSIAVVQDLEVEGSVFSGVAREGEFLVVTVGARDGVVEVVNS
jgi:hypothetical protein